ncbi:hypothetical protein OIDMADRAFT_40804 [Oidiodendron maius Zn]|uniref:Nitroreductase domain-containing protein n=1 Tax=Oidiodendron maius (strain Zn) TaxID=913774 RepID=A0A0C3DME5_OIDMZ|nr:hypothetical protein OIDMADRAFT_40804 [Oidiodendron maius Zn]
MPFFTAFFDIIKHRRSLYQLQKSSTISNTQIRDIITQAVLHHDRLWEITKESFKQILSAERFPATEKKLDGFKAGYGTILFFDAQSSISAMQVKFPTYADRFPTWATQSNGMHQFAVWAALEAEGLGCNLQHYNPIIDEKVGAEWDVPKDWKLDSQLVFGTTTEQAGKKTFLDMGERFKVYGA